MKVFYFLRLLAVLHKCFFQIIRFFEIIKSKENKHLKGFSTFPQAILLNIFI